MVIHVKEPVEAASMVVCTFNARKNVAAPYFVDTIANSRVPAHVHLATNLATTTATTALAHGSVMSHANPVWSHACGNVLTSSAPSPVGNCVIGDPVIYLVERFSSVGIHALDCVERNALRNAEFVTKTKFVNLFLAQKMKKMLDISSLKIVVMFLNTLALIIG